MKADGSRARRMVDRIASQAFGQELELRLESAKTEYVLAKGDRSLDQCLGLPLSAGKRRNLVRNEWLVLAQAELQATCDDFTPADLHAAMSRFVERGPWLRWQGLGGPPDDAARLHIALWHAVATNKGRVLSFKHLDALLKNRGRNFHSPALPFTLR